MFLLVGVEIIIFLVLVFMCLWVRFFLIKKFVYFKIILILSFF